MRGCGRTQVHRTDREKKRDTFQTWVPHATYPSYANQLTPPLFLSPGPTSTPPLQCLRRYIDERDRDQLYNAAKYLSAMTTVALKVAYSQNQSRLWLGLFAVSAMGTAIFANFWDLVKDWGLLNRRATVPWLRNNRVLSRAWVYYVAMVR